MSIRACLLGQAHTREELAFTRPTNDSREWMRALGGGDVLSYQRVLAERRLPRPYDVAIVELTPATYRLPILLTQWHPDLFCVALVEGHVEPRMSSAADMEAVYAFTRAVADYDLLGILVERALPWYRLQVSDAQRVQWIGVPYPLDWTASLPAVRLDQRELIIELGSAFDSRNGVTNVMLLRALQKEYPAVKGRIYWFMERERQMLADLGVDAELARPRRWQDHHRRMRTAFAVLCMDDRRTWGRYALDAAAAAVPFIGSNASHAGERVAVMTGDPFDAVTAFDHAERLIEERLRGGDELYRAVVERQTAALAAYGHDAARQRLAAAILAAGRPQLAEQIAAEEPCFAT